jgi:hypothetical protein
MKLQSDIAGEYLHTKQINRVNQEMWWLYRLPGVEHKHHIEHINDDRFNVGGYSFAARRILLKSFRTL